MTKLTIRETGSPPAAADGRSGFMAEVGFDTGAEFSVAIIDPFNPDQEAELGWYFEEHLRFPFVDRVRAADAGKSVTAYGHALFGQLFADPDARHEFKTAARAGLGTITLEVHGTPAFQRLHWEALKDPDLPRALALDAVVLRRVVQPGKTAQALPATVRDAPTLNILVVTARPGGAADVGYRTIARPMVEAAQNAGIPIAIDLVRPGSFRALLKHLEDATERHGAGHYHILHFDLHGGLLTHAQFQTGVATGTIFYDATARHGRGDLAPYEDQKAFLFFEDESKPGRADPVEASELAAQLIHHQVPIVVLNACQSGKPAGSAGESTLGSRLIEAGTQLVLAMAYSVTVSAARLMMEWLYQALMDRHELPAAIRRGRLALFNDKLRRAYFNEQVALEDWLLPVVYQNRPVQLTRRQMTPDEDDDWLARAARRYRAPATAFGFVGRDLDILEIERRLLRPGRNLLLVRGMGGAGKTTLLHHLLSWWQATGLIEKPFYFGYDQKAWTLQQLLHGIARELYGTAEYHRGFQSLPDDAAKQQRIVQDLRRSRHALVLDNLESITGTNLAIGKTLPKKEQAALHRFLQDLAGGRSLVVLGSRSGEAWLAPGSFVAEVVELRGLDPEARTELADLVLQRHGAEHHRGDPALDRLLSLLAGYPLALEIVLANLAQQTPAAVVAALTGGLDLATGDSEDKTRGILACIDYAFGNLDPGAQDLLDCLAPFTGVVYEEHISGPYTEELMKQPALAALPFGRWPEVLRVARDWGLLAPHPTVPEYFTIQPVLPYFLRRRAVAPDAAARTEAVRTAFRVYMTEFAKALGKLMKSKGPAERQGGQVLAGLEYENLASAVDLALAAGVSFVQPHFVISLWLESRQDHGRRLALAKQVVARLDQAGPPTALLFEYGAVIDNIASCLLSSKRLDDAKAAYHRALGILDSCGTADRTIVGKARAGLNHQLGKVAEEQLRWEEAEGHYYQALAIFIEFGDRQPQASTYHQLGMVAQKQRRWDEAEGYYRQALDIFVDSDNRYEQAGTYHQLGRLAQEQRRWEEAEGHYRQALDIFTEFGDRHHQASTYHQLGRVAQEQRRWEEAKVHYRRALTIDIEFRDRHGQASAYHQLGMVTQEQRRWEEAEGHYLQALTIFVAFKDQHRIEMAFRNLARLHHAADRPDLPAKVAKNLGVPADQIEAAFNEPKDE